MGHLLSYLKTLSVWNETSVLRWQTFFQTRCCFSRQTLFNGMLSTGNGSHLHYSMHYHSPERAKNYSEIAETSPGFWAFLTLVYA